MGRKAQMPRSARSDYYSAHRSVPGRLRVNMQLSAARKLSSRSELSMKGSEFFSRYDDYAIAWLCALTVEMAAAEAMLDERHPDLPTKHNDDNTYILGRVHSHNIVIACLPSGVYGVSSAAKLAAGIRFTFPSIQFGLMVGIGGGVPGSPANVRLGDVVVSKPSRDFGGVVQYDFGKVLDSGHFVRTGVLNKPPTVLLTAISRLQAAHMLRGNDIPDLVSLTLNKYPLMKGTFQRPDEPEDEELECLDQQAFSETSRRQRQDAGPTKLSKSLTIHYGLIASGDKVMKDNVIRDKLTREYGFLCFEMEAAGLMDNFPCLVIRGISDYADSKKNKDWQGYASLTAAAYAKQLLSSIHTNQVPEDLVRTSTGRSLTKPSNLLEKVISYKDWVVRGGFQIDEALLPHITSYDHEKVHQRLSRKRLMGTTRWFVRHMDFQLWLSGKALPFLWCSGKIGSGKTIIATAVIEEARLHCSSLEAATVFFYFDEQQATDQRQLVLSSFVKQLCEFLIRTSRPFPGDVEEMLWRNFGLNRQVPDLEDLQALFTRLFYLVPNTVYVLDGLDSLEKYHAKSLLTYFRTLFCEPGPSPSGSRALFLSRDHLAGNMAISMFFAGIPRISTSENVIQDISVYIDESIAEKMIFKKLTADDQLVMAMKSVLARESSGMFLWVYLQIEIIWDTCVTDAEIRHTLTTLPKDLEETYRRCMKRIEVQDTRTLNALIWTRFAVKPLHIEELQEAVAFTMHDTSWDQSKIPRSDFVLGSCANLLVLDSADNRVRFAHSSIIQFFENNSDAIPGLPRSFEEGDRSCGEFCITYLSFSDFSLQIDRPREKTAKMAVPDISWLAATLSGSQLMKSFFRGSTGQIHNINLPLHFIRGSFARPREQYKFLGYATKNWARHTKRITPSHLLWEKFARLALTVNESWNIHPWTSGGRSHLSHVHALFGWAVEECHKPLLQLTLGVEGVTEHLVDIPLVGESLPALHLACKLGFQDIVLDLLAVCNFNKASVDGLTPLHYAAMKGHLEIVNELLKSAKIVLDARSNSGATPLWLAASRGWSDIVSALIQRGANMEKSDLEARTPLLIAVLSRHVTVVNLLIQMGADPMIEDSKRCNSLRWAIKNQDMVMVNILLDHVCRILSTENENFPELLFAVEENQDEVIALMLEMGLNPNAKFHRDDPIRPGTLLAWAAAQDHQNLARLLLEKGADVNLQDHVGWTPLTQAAGFGREEMVRLLIRQGAQINFPRNDMTTPLQSAAECGHVGTVKLLLEHGAEIEHKGLASRAPLGSAARNGQHAVLKLLIERGAFLEDTDYKCRTPLIRAAEEGHNETIKTLLLHGASRDATDYDGRTALIAAAQCGHLETARLLVE